MLSSVLQTDRKVLEIKFPVNAEWNLFFLRNLLALSLLIVLRVYTHQSTTCRFHGQAGVLFLFIFLIVI